MFDVTGRVVATINNAKFTTGPNNITYSTSNLAPGVYIIRLTSNGGSATKKIVVAR